MISIQGYTIYIPDDKKVIKILNKSKGEFIYTHWLLSDKIVKFGNPPTNLNGQYSISADQLSNDYFSSKNLNCTYHVPMCCYPLFYKKSQIFENLNLSSSKRKRSVFMAGNFDAEYYGQIDNSPVFNQPSRRKIVDFLKEKKYHKTTRSVMQLEEYIDGETDNDVILIDTNEDFKIPFTSLFNYLSKFEFFLALPGITIPQSHNLIEAMACGCIPIIHKEYAGLMQPPLEDGINAFLFSDLEELHKLILRTFEIQDVLFNKISKNVTFYYTSFLTPEAVVDEIIKPELDCIYIQAEHVSLNLKSKNAD
jgi:glycosyltransferase involved in cell wall biosynthesis